MESASLPEQRIHYTTLAALPMLAAAEMTGLALILMGPQLAERIALVQEIIAERCRNSTRMATGVPI